MTEAVLNHPGDETLRALSLGQLTETELADVFATSATVRRVAIASINWPPTIVY